MYYFRPKRGEGLQWILFSEGPGLVEQRSSPVGEEKDIVFRLEILNGD